MYKKIVIGLVLVLLFVSLTGCTENSNIVSSTGVKLLNHTIGTYEGSKKLGDGFVSNPNADRYIIEGRIKNNLGHKATYIKVKVNFYDKDGNYLDSDSTIINDLPNTYERDFKIHIYDWDIDYFENVRSLKFDIYETNMPI